MDVNWAAVVIGAGPVGLTTALLLQKLGHKVLILERRAEPYPQPRAVALFHQGVRAFGALGLLDRLIESKAIQDIGGHIDELVQYVDGEEQVVVEFPFNLPLSKSGTAASYSIHQPTMEEELKNACGDRGVQIRRSTELTGVVDMGSHVELEVAEVYTDLSLSPSRQTIKASFVVGCDGSKSAVRRLAKIDFVEFAPAMSRWLVLDILPTIPGATARWKDFHHGKQYLDPKRPRTSVPSPLNRRRFEFMVMPEESNELALTDEFVWKMLVLFDCSPDTARIERKTVYSINGGWAESFARGRIVLAGDAAHVAPQFLAQGLNAGLRDAKSLAWRLDYALKKPKVNWANLLSQYSDEQLSTTKTFVAAAKELEKMLIITNPDHAKATKAFLQTHQLPIPNLERVGAPGMHLSDGKTTFDSRCEPGTLFIHDRVRKDEKTGFFDEVIGEGWALMVKDSVDLVNALDPATRHSFINLIGGHLVGLSGDGSCEDLSGRYTDWFGDVKAEAVLVRPDYYIYGTATRKDGINDLVKSAVSHFSS